MVPATSIISFATRTTLFAQSLGEYAGGSGGIAAELASVVQSGSQWHQLSLREHRLLWITAALVLGLWAFRRR